MEWGGEGRGSVFTHLPVTTSHTRTVPSSDPAGRLPWLHTGQRAAASMYLTYMYIHNVRTIHVCCTVPEAIHCPRGSMCTHLTMPEWPSYTWRGREGHTHPPPSLAGWPHWPAGRAHNGLCGGEWLKVSRLWQFRNQLLRIHLHLSRTHPEQSHTDPLPPPSLPSCSSHSHLPLPGTEVEVQAALKPLLDEARVSRHLPQARVPVDRDRLTLTGGLQSTGTHERRGQGSNSLPREEVPLALVGLLLLPLLCLQARDKDNLTQWPPRLSGPAHLAGGREVLWGRVVRLVVARQRLFGCRDVHVVAATGLGLVSVPPQHVELWSLWLLPRLQPAHLDGVHQPRHLLGFPARRDEAALWLDCVAQRVNPLLTAKEIHVGLREKAVSLHSSTTTHSIYNVYSN